MEGGGGSKRRKNVALLDRAPPRVYPETAEEQQLAFTHVGKDGPRLSHSASVEPYVN